MIETEISLPRIRQSLFDPMQNRDIENYRWRLGGEAMPLEALPADQQQELKDMLSPAIEKIERVSAVPPKTEVVIGGLCSIFTGDLDAGKEREAVGLLRMDQLVEAVGSVRGKPIFVVMEDSFFSNLKGLPISDLQNQAAQATERITRWLDLTTGESPDLRFALTSDPKLEKGIYEAVRYMAYDVLKNPDFARVQAAPIILMYTSVWSDLLASLSYIPSRNVVCVEPAVHFVDDRSFPDYALTRAYRDFLSWLKDNPYGTPKSANATIGIAGFLESTSGDQTKKRTRLLPYTEVPTTVNVKTWVQKLQEQAAQFPFPLRNSPVFAEAVNWGLWNPLIREQVAKLISLEDEYYQQRDAMRANKQGGQANALANKEQAQRLREFFIPLAQPTTQILAKEVGEILSTVLGE